uniref:Reverse transcriptase zinc-binding domain-containing protein n=1 Tax=Setaria viridis TaxID=4556 RepID=A0A4U6UPC6_SETVI|nr:hypothetical protein SEVIR_5G287200v2 [Setaria viridis]
MPLQSTTCEICILQKRETAACLFLRCNFAKACWASIGITYTPTRRTMSIFNAIRRRLQLPFFMEIIVLMAWSIWTTRNAWTFNNVAPTVPEVKHKFISEIRLIAFHRVNCHVQSSLLDWIDSLGDLLLQKKNQVYIEQKPLKNGKGSEPLQFSVNTGTVFD